MTDRVKRLGELRIKTRPIKHIQYPKELSDAYYDRYVSIPDAAQPSPPSHRITNDLIYNVNHPHINYKVRHVEPISDVFNVVCGERCAEDTVDLSSYIIKSLVTAVEFIFN